jgi:hypothetical protein
LAAIDRDHAQPIEHGGRLARPEIAGIERADVRAQKRLKLVQGDVLARAEIAAVVEAERAVRLGDLIVGQPAECLSVRGGVVAGRRGAGRMREARRPGRPDFPPSRGGRAQDPRWPLARQVVQAHDAGDRRRDRGRHGNGGSRRLAD